MFIQAKKRMIPLPIIFTLVLTSSFSIYLYQFATKDNFEGFIEIMPVFIFLALLNLFLFGFLIIAFLDYLKPLRDNKAGITLDNIGVEDNLSIFSLGFIPWNNIHGAKIVRTNGFNFIVIYIVNDQNLIQSQPYWKRYFLQKWKKKWGSPVVISEKRIRYDIVTLTKNINSKAGDFKP